MESSWHWPVLTPENCFFIVLHSHLMGLFVTGRKYAESRRTKVGRTLIVLVSAVKDNGALPWESDPSIQPNTIYCVGWVHHIDKGVEGDFAACNWVFDPLCVLPVPIALNGVGVGRGHVAPRAEHVPALRQINTSLLAINAGMSGKGKGGGCMPCSTYTWEVFDEAKEIKHPHTMEGIPLELCLKVPGSQTQKMEHDYGDERQCPSRP